MANPSLEEFIAAARPLNPDATDDEIVSYWRQNYAPKVEAPSLEVFAQAAKPLNPSASDDEIKSYWEANYKSAYEAEQNKGGFKASAKQAIGATIKGAGQAAADFIPGIDQDNAVRRYGQSVMDANPTAVQSLSDIPEKPVKALTEATGNAAGSMAGMLATRAVGQGITAASPLAGPFAPAVAAVGQAISWLGPAAIAALPSFGGIRDKQILNDPDNQESGRAKAVAALGAAAVGAIEVASGPQNWALLAFTREGRSKLAEKFAATTIPGFIAKGAAIEGAEELAQNPIEQLAAGDDPTTKESLGETALGGAMGAIGGGVLGGGAGIIGNRMQRPTPPADPIAETLSPATPILEAPDLDSAIQAAASVSTQDTTIADAADRAQAEIAASVENASVRAAGDGIIGSAQNVPDMGTIAPEMGTSPVGDNAAVAPAGDIGAEQAYWDAYQALPDNRLPVTRAAPTFEQQQGQIAQDADEARAEARKPAELDVIQAARPAPTALEVAMKEARGRAMQAEQDRAERERLSQERAQREAERARQDVLKPKPEDLPILQRLLKREAVTDAEAQPLLAKGFIGTRPDGSYKVIEKGLKARNFLLRQAEPKAPAEAITPKTVGGIPVSAQSDEQLQAIASAPETPATTRHTAVAALKARENAPDTEIAPNTEAIAPPNLDFTAPPKLEPDVAKPRQVATTAEESQQGPEVERFQGKYGKGMNVTPARLALKDLSAKQPDLAWSIEKTTNPEFPDRFDVVGRRIGETVKSTAKAAQAITGAKVAEKQGIASVEAKEPLRIPIIMGRNRLRGKSVGALVQDDLGELDALRSALSKEATAQGVEPTKEWMGNAVSGLLRIYESNLKAWEKDKGDTIGFVFEGRLPSGRSILMGEQGVLNRMGNRKPAKAPTTAQPAVPAQPTAKVENEAQAPAAQGGFDPEAFDKKRADTIKASRATGAIHLDKVPAAVETMRGREIYYAHDPKVRGIVRSVANTGEVVVHWLDKYSAEKELASASEETNKAWLKAHPNKQVFSTWLAPSDLKDYVFADSAKSQPANSESPKAADNSQRSAPTTGKDREMTRGTLLAKPTGQPVGGYYATDAEGNAIGQRNPGESPRRFKTAKEADIWARQQAKKEPAAPAKPDEELVPTPEAGISVSDGAKYEQAWNEGVADAEKEHKGSQSSAILWGYGKVFDAASKDAGIERVAPHGVQQYASVESKTTPTTYQQALEVLDEYLGKRAEQIPQRKREDVRRYEPTRENERSYRDYAVDFKRAADKVSEGYDDLLKMVDKLLPGSENAQKLRDALDAKRNEFLGIGNQYSAHADQIVADAKSAEDAKYKPFENVGFPIQKKELGLTKSSASWLMARYKDQDWYSNGHMATNVKPLKSMDSAWGERHQEARKDRPDLEKVTSSLKGKAVTATPIGEHDDGKIRKVLFDADGKLTAINRIYYDLIRSLYAQAHFVVRKGYDGNGPLEVALPSNTLVGIVMPMRIGKDEAQTVEAVKEAIARNEGVAKPDEPTEAPEPAAPVVEQNPEVAPKSVEQMSAADLLRAAADKMEGKPAQESAAKRSGAATTPDLAEARGEELRKNIRTFWMSNVAPALRDYFSAFRDMGAQRLEANRVKPEGMSAADWLLSFLHQSSTWDKGRKTGLTGIQSLSQKGLWPTDDGKGEALRKSMLAAVKALKAAPGSNGDWIRNIEQGSYDGITETKTPADSLQKPPILSQKEGRIGDKNIQDSETIETRDTDKGIELRMSDSSALDPSAQESAKVESAISGKSLLNAARFVIKTGSADHKLIAERVLLQLQRLDRAGIALNLKIAHVGDMVPRTLLVARGLTSWKVGKGDKHATVWLNGSDVVGKVGVSYETLLHELVHAATAGVMHLGNLKIATENGYKTAQDVTDLWKVTNHVRSYFNKRVAEAKSGNATLTEFENRIYQQANNAIADADEVLAWGLTNPEAQAYFESIAYPEHKSAWTAFVDAIRKILGIPARAATALSEVLRVYENLTGENTNDILGIATASGEETGIQSGINSGLLAQQNAASETDKGAALFNKELTNGLDRAGATGTSGIPKGAQGREASGNGRRDSHLPSARVSAGITESTLRAEIAKAFGPKAASMVGDILIPMETQAEIESVSELSDVVPLIREGDRISGFYHPATGKTYAILENLTPEGVKGLALHEIGVHYGLEGMLGKEGYARLSRQLDAMRSAGNKAVIEAHKQATEQAAKPSQVPEETLAYLVTNRPELPFVQRLIAQIKAFLFRKFGILGNKLTVDDIAALAQASVLHASEGVRNGEPQFMVAWHGSPHDFDEFSLHKIGTGEGAQAYGWGMYFAGSRDVAEWYREKLNFGDQFPVYDGKGYSQKFSDNKILGTDKPSSFSDAVNALWKAGGNKNRAISAYDGVTEKTHRYDYVEHVREVQKIISELDADKLSTGGGRIYQVNLSPSEDEYLDWDKPLSEQSEKVRAAFAVALKQDRNALGPQSGATKFLDKEVSGADLYKSVMDRFNVAAKDVDGGRDFGANAEAASRYLASIGIPGIRYLDGSSRGKGEGNSNYVIFDDKHISIAAKFSRSQDQTQTEASFSRNTVQGGAVGAPEWVQDQPADMQETLRKAGAWRPKQTLQERFADWTANWQQKLKQGMVDQFDPIKSLNYRAYMLARMTKSAAGPLESALFDGTVFIDKDGAVDVNYEKGGFIGKMQALKGEHDRFFAWVVGNRAARLMEEGREHNFSKEDIARLKTLNRGKMEDGVAREVVYMKALADLNRYNKSILDMAEKAGLIDAEARPFWEKDFYIPFYRITEGDETKGPVKSGGLVRQYAFKTLKGGEQAIGDPMENILKNWAHLIDASLKNQAAVATMDAAVKVGVAHETTADEKGAVFVMKDGKKTYYGVDDPFVLDAINSMGFSGFSGPAMKVMSSFKRWLTYGVTISPTFRVRNVIRDSISMIGTNPASYNVLDNVLTGWKLTEEDSPSYASMIAGGGVIRFGTLERDGAANVKRLVDAGVEAGTILNSQAKVKAMLKDAYDWWMRVGDRSENVNRAALYQKLRDEGKSHLEASYAARDTMDFSMMGTWSAVRFLAQTVPFFNARLQGMYKLGRGAAEDPRRFAYVVGATALASIALLLAYKDDDDWKQREDFDRESFWWFKIGDKAFRIPKPFEIGAIGTLAERGLEAMITDDLTGKQFIQRMGSVVGQQLSMNPVPQLFMPMIETWANKDSFTGRAIETLGMEKLSPSERIGAYTSAFAQLAGKNGIVSPVQIDHLINGYFGWLGTHAVATADLALRPGMSLPEKPAMRVDDFFVLGDFARNLPAYQSKYVTRLYEQGREVQQVMADMRAYQKIGATEKAAEILKDNGDKIRLYRLYTHAEQQLTKINQKIKMTQKRTGDADVKRTRLDQLYAQRNRIAKITEDRARATQQ